jgi:hypothetical protein
MQVTRFGQPLLNYIKTTDLHSSDFVFMGEIFKHHTPVST